MLNLSNTSFLSANEIKSKASSIFTTTGIASLSDKYTHIPTSQVIEDMEKLGWGVVDAKEIKARKRVGFQKHLVIFRHPDIMISGDDGDDVFPQILMSNSHDGTSAFKFQAGIFRMVCENGLVVSTEEFENVSIRHMGYTFEELQSQIHAMVERLPFTVEIMNRMKTTQLDEKQKEEFVVKALTTRFPGEEVQHIKIDAMELLQPTRKEDEGDDVWTIFNIIQEKILNGGFQYNNGAKTRKARKIKNFQQDLKVNKELFEVALEFTH